MTPFSNNATICSYPVFGAVNPLPAGESVAHLDQLCEQANPKQNIELPTAVGFCMYIRRPVLNKIGLFDVETFGRGYGEENDFCARAIKAGYHNILALDTFVAHAGGVSFAAEQSALQQNAGTALRQKHPEYDAWVADHIFHNPAQLYRARIDLLRFSQSALPLILCILHAHGGGTQKYVEDLANALYGEANVLALQPDELGAWTLSAPLKYERLSLHFARNQQQDLLQLLQLLNISRIHYQHLLGLDATFRALPETLGVAYDFTAHDFYTLDENAHLNGASITVNNKQVEKFSPFLSRADRLFVPSQRSQAILSTGYPQLNFIPVAHPDTIVDTLPEHDIPDITSRPIQVLIIGALNPEKGADILAAAVKHVKQHQLPIHFHLLGYTYHQLTTNAQLSVYGRYEQGDLAALIEQIDPHWIWFPAQTPETYSYTLSSAMAAGYPVLASDLGAFVERLSRYPFAKICPWDSTVTDWCQVMLRRDYTAMDDSQAIAKPFSQQDYLAPIPTPRPVTQELSIIDFAVFAKGARQWQYRFTVHDTKILLLRSLVRLKKQPLLAKLLHRLPTGWQLRVKNWLLGANR
ncbi:MAG: hypothetical protein CR977_01695 [Gammaproteobacteria bacterium]|nr:MAG: hypothetical protein CR977_01695 [Gammaproteobacteria bacterium]